MAHMGMDVAERQEYQVKSKNRTRNKGNVWIIIGNPSSQEVGKPWTEST